MAPLWFGRFEGVLVFSTPSKGREGGGAYGKRPNAREGARGRAGVAARWHAIVGAGTYAGAECARGQKLLQKLSEQTDCKGRAKVGQRSGAIGDSPTVGNATSEMPTFLPWNSPAFPSFYLARMRLGVAVVVDADQENVACVFCQLGGILLAPYLVDGSVDRRSSPSLP